LVSEREIMNKNKLKKKIKECINRVYASEGALEKATAEAMSAIDKYSQKIEKTKKVAS
jgi:hypothetical protein